MVAIFTCSLYNHTNAISYSCCCNALDTFSRHLVIIILSNESVLFLPCSINETIFEETATAASFKEIRRRDP